MRIHKKNRYIRLYFIILPANSENEIIDYLQFLCFHISMNVNILLITHILSTVTSHTVTSPTITSPTITSPAITPCIFHHINGLVSCIIA